VRLAITQSGKTCPLNKFSTILRDREEFAKSFARFEADIGDDRWNFEMIQRGYDG